MKEETTYNLEECPICGEKMVKEGQCKYVHLRCLEHDVVQMIPLKLWEGKK